VLDAERVRNKALAEEFGLDLERYGYF